MKSPSVRVTAAVALCLLGSGLSGCVYRMSIQQGNFLEKRIIDQLQVGMTRKQVRYLLGTPMVPDTFDRDRWDYVYYFKRGRARKPIERRLTVFFKEDKVADFEKFNMPANAPDAEKPDKQAPIEKFPKI